MAFETHEAEQQDEQQSPAPVEADAEEATPEAPEEFAEATPDEEAAARNAEADESAGDDAAQIAEAPQGDAASIAAETEAAEEEMPGAEDRDEQDGGLELEGLDVPAGKRGGAEDLDFDPSEMGQDYDAPLDADMLPENFDALDGGDAESESDMPAPGGGAHRVLIIGNVLFFAAVVAFILILMWRKDSERQVNEGAPPAPEGYVYFTDPKTPAREIEDVLASLVFDQGEAKGERVFVREDYASIARTPGKPEECQVVIRLKPTYWDEAMVKPDAEDKAVRAIRALFDRIPGLKKVVVKMLFKFSTEPGAKPEAALTVVAQRTEHEKAEYGKGEPGDMLKAFKTTYHPKLVAP